VAIGFAIAVFEHRAEVRRVPMAFSFQALVPLVFCQVVAPGASGREMHAIETQRIDHLLPSFPGRSGPFRRSGFTPPSRVRAKAKIPRREQVGVNV
jgi:hypothetical protein